MSDKWETVGSSKKPRKPKPPAPVVGVASTEGGAVVVTSNGQAGGGKPGKPKKRSAKIPAMFPLAEETEVIPETSDNNDKKAQVTKKSEEKSQSQKKKNNLDSNKPKEKRRDLEKSLGLIPVEEHLAFFKQLKNSSSSTQDICLSWIKYSADALNTSINHLNFIPPEVSQWPNDLTYPTLPPSLQEGIRTIIAETEGWKQDSVDVLGISFSSLLASIPTLVQRGDPCWGYMLFLRELCWFDPSLPIRRVKSFSEIMDSHGNRGEVGLCVLWAVAQAGFDSRYVLKIISKYLLPYYGFKHYKQFVLAALSTIAANNSLPPTTPSAMASEYLIEVDEFDEFFEASYDPKKKRDLEKIYPRVKELVLKNLKDQGPPVFLRFLKKLGNKEFLPISPYGSEVFQILLGCLESSPACMDAWRENLANLPKESSSLLSYLAKVPDVIKCGRQLEEKLIQTDEFAVAAVKNPELLRYAKKVQVGLERVAIARRRSGAWKWYIVVVLGLIGGLLYLDVTENGKGTFEASNTGKFLKHYGLLPYVMIMWSNMLSLIKYVQGYLTVLFRSINEALQPLLQQAMKKINEYIPQLVEYLQIIGNFILQLMTNVVSFLQTNVFVGPLSPENLRRVTKDALSFIWTNILAGVEKLYTVIESYLTSTKS